MQRFITAIKAGNYQNAACAYAGIGETTILRWMELGRKSNSPKEYKDLVAAVEQAELEAEANAVLQWRIHMKTDYRAIRDFMERRYPRRWGRTEKIIHEGGVPVTGPAPDSVLGKITGNATAMATYNDLLVVLSNATRPQPSGTGHSS